MIRSRDFKVMPSDKRMEAFRYTVAKILSFSRRVMPDVRFPGAGFWLRMPKVALRVVDEFQLLTRLVDCNITHP